MSVNRELSGIETALTLLRLFPIWLSRRECRERSMSVPFGAEGVCYERSTNMRRHEDWILVSAMAVFRQ
jgi:hypothetical protein